MYTDDNRPTTTIDHIPKCRSVGKTGGSCTKTRLEVVLIYTYAIAKTTRWKPKANDYVQPSEKGVPWSPQNLLQILLRGEAELWSKRTGFHARVYTSLFSVTHLMTQINMPQT